MQINLNPEIEKYTRNTIFSDLQKGDPKRDVPHTEGIVHYVKEIIKTLPEDDHIDPVIVILSAYAHDWGYAPFFKEGEPLEFDEYMEAKKKHMDIGAKLTKKLLEDAVYSELSEKQKERVVHLVQVHDNLGVLKDLDELILMEADTLAGLDTDFMKPTFDPEGNSRYLESVKNKRYPLFVTEYSKDKFPLVLRKREDYYAEGLWKE